MTSTHDTAPIAAQIEALAPCPFCGGTDPRLEEEGERFFIACQSVECFCALGEGYDRDATSDHCFPTAEHAIAAWNTRPAIVAALGQGERMVLVPRVLTQEVKDAMTEVVILTGTGGKTTALNWEEAQEVWDAALAALEPLPPSAAPPPAPDERDDEVRRLREALRNLEQAEALCRYVVVHEANVRTEEQVWTGLREAGMPPAPPSRQPREGKMLCKLFGHHFGKWDWWPFGGRLGQARWCLRCREIQTREIDQ